MPDKFLVGNGRWCSCCYPEGRPDQPDIGRHYDGARFGCNECAGKGRIALTAEEIVAATVSEVKTWKGKRDAH